MAASGTGEFRVAAVARVDIFATPFTPKAMPRIETGFVRITVSAALLVCVIGPDADAQEPAAWGESPRFHTFSIAAVEPRTGETGVAVTTRVACVGNAVPWVRAGVGAVATQAYTRVEYGRELLDDLEAGIAPAEALRRRTAADTGLRRRQVGVIAADGRSAQHTGEGTDPWTGGRSGKNYVTQGNLLVGPGVLAAVASSFEATEGSPRHLADRLIEALAAGYAAGGDARKGRTQSAAVIVADPRPGKSRRPDKVTASINICEHAEPVAELRRIYETISQTLGYRTLEQFGGGDVWQLKVILHALGYYRAGTPALERDGDWALYTLEAVTAVNAFRAAEGLAGPSSGVPAGLVDDETVARLWTALERAGKARVVREKLLDATAVLR